MSLSSGVVTIAVLGGFAVVMLTVAALIGSTKRPRPETEPSGVAWRDGDDLVVTVGLPLPPRCLLCGDPSSYRVAPSALLRNLGARPDAALALNGNRLPLCDVHYAAQHHFERNVALSSTGAFVVLVVNTVVLIASGALDWAVMFLPSLMAFGGVFTYSLARRPGRLLAGRATVRHVRIRGASQALLDTLPSFTMETVS